MPFLDTVQANVRQVWAVTRRLSAALIFYEKRHGILSTFGDGIDLRAT